MGRRILLGIRQRRRSDSRGNGSLDETKHHSIHSFAFYCFAHIDENKALQGGGAIFWEDEPPGNTERYRNKSTPNTALYEDDVATPARALSVVTNSRRRTTAATTLSGRELESPLAFELLDGYGQRGMSDDTSILLAELVDTSGTTTLSGPLAICEQGLATFTDLAIFAFPEVTVRFNVSIPALSEHVSPPTWISRLRNVLLA